MQIERSRDVHSLYCLLTQLTTSPLSPLPFASGRYVPHLCVDPHLLHACDQHPTTIPALQVPRATHKHTAVLRRRGTTFVFASSRWSPYLPDSLRDFFPKSAHFVRGATGESCESACRRDGARCELGLFEFANQVTQRAIAWLLLGITC